MSRTFEVKTSKDGQQDIFTIKGDFIDFTDQRVTIFKDVPDEDPRQIAAFMFWVYGIELPLDEDVV